MEIAVTMCDDKFVRICIRMIKSYKRYFTKDIYVGSLNLSKKNIELIEKEGAKILHSKTKFYPKNLCVCDLTLIDYLYDISWTKVMWLDADIIHLTSAEHLFDLDYDYIGIPGRGIKGLITENQHGTHYAMGMWVTRSKELLYDFYNLIYKNHNLNYEGIEASKIINNGKYSHFQLDGDIYNFSREAVSDIYFDKNQNLYYLKDGKKIYPNAVGFPRLENGQRNYNFNLFQILNYRKFYL
jgi:hypothetical protein